MRRSRDAFCVGAWLLLAATLAPAQDVNIALGRPVSASGPVWSGQVPEHLTDGDHGNQSHPLASSGTRGFYYEIDLEVEFSLDRIVVFNRRGCCPERLTNYRVAVHREGAGGPGAVAWSADVRTDGSNCGDGGHDTLTADLDPDGEFRGRYLRVTNLSGDAYNPQIAELEVYEAPAPIIERFRVDHGNITRIGDPTLPTSATLFWRASRVSSIDIAPGVGAVPAPEGSVTVSPDRTTTYTLTAHNETGSRAATVTVGVDETTIAPILTEFLAGNDSLLDDEDGDSSDWIEIHNPNGFDLGLEGYSLVEGVDRVVEWRFPAASIPAGGFLVVFASGKDRRDPDGELHTSFRLDRDGDHLALVAPDGVTILQQFPADHPASLVYPEQKADVSYGIGESGQVGFLDPPSPGAPNGSVYRGFVADTEFSVDRGLHEAPIDVEIRSATDGAEIRYTLDGSRPTPTHGSVYSGPVRIETTTVLRAAAFAEGMVPTNVDTHTYIFLDDVIASRVMDPGITQHPEYGPRMRAALVDLPSLSVVTEGSIHDTREVGVSLEWIPPDGSRGFQEDAGVRYFGGAFTSFAKKNFRLYFRGEYGARKLRYPLFAGHDRGIRAVEVFDQLELRGGSHDMSMRGFYMSNRFTDDTMLEMGNLNPHGRFVHLYLDGTYWGQYHLRERWNADMLAQYLGGEKEDYEAINGNWNVGGWADPGSPYDGDGSAWARVKSLRDDYEAIWPYLDVPHYVDYMLLFMFGDAETEYRCVGPRGPGSGFKFLLNDADGFTRSVGNRTTMGQPGRQAGDGPGSIFSMLLAEGHPDYRTLLGDRIHRHFFNDGAMTPERNTARLLSRCREVEVAFLAEAARWGYRSPSSWAGARDAYVRSVLPGRTATVVSQFRAAGFYPTVAAPRFSQHGGAIPEGFRPGITSAAGTIYYVRGGDDPRLPGGAVSPAARVVSAGGPRVELVGARSGVKARIPADGDLGTSWTEPGFDDSGWWSEPEGAGVGYDDQTTYLEHIDIDVHAMQGAGASVYVRYPFTVDDAASLSGLELRVRYDDGYVAYLNGVRIASRHAPEAPGWDSVATDNHADSSAVRFESADLTHGAPHLLLSSGWNVLAVHALNGSVDSPDLLVEAELTARLGEEEPGLLLDRTTRVRARARVGDEWSAVTEAVFVVDSGALRITELMYHPPDPPPGSGFQDEDFEFVELLNTGDRPLNLTGITLRGGIDFEFPDRDATPDEDLAPGETVLVVGRLDAFASRYDTTGLYIAGEYDGRLENGGETIRLLDRAGATLLEFGYTDDWYPATDGEGRSLEIVDPLDAPGVWGAAESWRPSRALLGSPGTASIPGSFPGVLPGDANRDMGVDVSDAIALLLHLFAGGDSLPCGDGTLADASNRQLLDVSGDGGVDIADAVALLEHLFRGGPPPALGVECVALPGCPDLCPR